MSRPALPSPPHPVTEGDRFRYVDADGTDRLYQVFFVHHGGGHTARVCCSVVDEATGFAPEDDHEVEPAEFEMRGEDTIEASLRRRNEVWTRREAESDAFFAATPVGTVIHYKAGPGRWLRGNVVLDPSPYAPAGSKVFLGSAMVGEWTQDDRVNYGKRGEPVYGAWAKRVVEGVTCEVSAADVWESAVHVRRPGAADPTTLPALSLDLPPAEPGQQEEFAAARYIEQILAAASAPGTAVERKAAVLALVGASAA